MLNWADRFGICCFLDNNDYYDPYHQYDCIIAAGATKVLKDSDDIFSSLNCFNTENDNWIFGHLGYDLKNKIELLESGHENRIGFPDVFFFIPEIVLILQGEVLTIHSEYKNPGDVFSEIQDETYVERNKKQFKKILLSPAISKEEYVSTVEKIQQHIRRGDCYEINFCQEFFAEDICLDTLDTFDRLQQVSPTPFSCYYKLNDKYLLCASPERFLSKRGSAIFSQPIKGTAPRNIDKRLDEIEKNNLFKSEKERSENVMIVDLVRNDLSKICTKGSVETTELFGIYSFPQVHQMISTIKGELIPGISFSEIIQSTFPMGSMTGAPKISAMKLIEKFETSKRGLFSGSVGYISPQKDFDFNVIIRSIFYNATNKYLNYMVGGAITFYADAEKEYGECLLKAKAITSVLQ
ncbi:MAG: anthranilate synthase component I family protein [Bacteroidetes bacterium]|nr:anthranilate synthase component I family protein [Bacteroidota bacterium]